MQLGSILQFIKIKEVKKAKCFLLILKKWQTSFNDNLSNNCQPVLINGRTIKFAVSSSVWSHKLFLEKESILKEINNEFMKFSKIDFTVISPSEILKIKAENEAIFLKKTKEKKTNYKVSKNIKSIVKKIKDKQIELTNKEWQICQKCARLFKSDKHSICLLCLNKEQERLKIRLVKTLKEAPWLDFAKSDFKNLISKKDFLAIKENLKLEILGQINSALFLEKNFKGDFLAKNAYTYVFLKTGLNPQAMTENIFEVALGKKRYEMIFKKKGQ